LLVAQEFYHDTVLSQTFASSILKAAAMSTGPLTDPASALGRSRLAPSERVTVGLVGCGERGMQVASDFLKDSRVQITAVCDAHDCNYRELKWGQGKELGRDQPPEACAFVFGVARNVVKADG
jgi:hypothetical protein